MAKTLMAVDAGTGSVRAVLFSLEGEQLGCVQQEWTHKEDPRYPGSMDFDWVHNWDLARGCIRGVIEQTGVDPHDIAAVSTTCMREGIVLHSDRGSQYCSPIYQSVLLEKGIVISMSRPGMPYDNAPMESFFSILKNEELRLFKHLTCSQMHTFIDCFIRYYNEDRPQWSLKKLTPFEFRSQLV